MKDLRSANVNLTQLDQNDLPLEDSILRRAMAQIWRGFVIFSWIVIINHEAGR